MGGSSDTPGKGSGSDKQGFETREDRLKKALKANMARRKAQARGRAADEAEASKDDHDG